ncbi:MAG: hypothetical protein P9M11_04075 [Candidatus Tenebribacter burtonii]|jgi:hypothetical protein|nr:hypothetical protein [Candidatus Tenebribacter burtonii]
MRKGYLIVLLLLILSWLLLLLCDFHSHPRITYSIQISSIFIAFFVAIIALHASDKPTQKIEIKNIVYANKEKGEYYKKDFNKKLLDEYINYPDPVTAHQIYFKITNKSGFTLEQPTLTFKLPSCKKHPYKQKEKYNIKSFNTNLYNSTKDMKLLDTGDSIYISNSNLPFWNNNDTLKFWIRMSIEGSENTIFKIAISVNAKNANGITENIVIDPNNIVYKTI